MVAESGAVGILAWLIWLNYNKDKMIFAMLTDFTRLLQKLSDTLEDVRRELVCLRGGSILDGKNS